VPRSSFSLHTNQRKTISAAGLRAGPQEGTILRDATATLGSQLATGRAADGMTHMGSPLPHRGRDMGLHTVSALHRTPLCLSAPHPSPPHPYICPPCLE